VRRDSEGEGREEMKEGRQGRGIRRLTRQFSCKCVHSVGFRWPKTVWWAPVPPPF